MCSRKPPLLLHAKWQCSHVSVVGGVMAVAGVAVGGVAVACWLGVVVVGVGQGGVLVPVQLA